MIYVKNNRQILILHQSNAHNTNDLHCQEREASDSNLLRESRYKM